MAAAQVGIVQHQDSYTPVDEDTYVEETPQQRPHDEAPSAIELILNPLAYPKYNFAFANFLEKDYKFPVQGDRAICKDYQQGNCTLGENCSKRHPKRTNYNQLICKHWVRGLCKKGEKCEFLHEYNLRLMPECTSFSRYGACPNGTDCLYLHTDPAFKVASCAHYERGFCPLGPRCAARHIKKHKRICEFYMAGFCPDGRDCTRGAHPVWREKSELDPPVIAGTEATLTTAVAADPTGDESGNNLTGGAPLKMERETSTSGAAAVGATAAAATNGAPAAINPYSGNYSSYNNTGMLQVQDRSLNSSGDGGAYNMFPGLDPSQQQYPGRPNSSQSYNPQAQQQIYSGNNRDPRISGNGGVGGSGGGGGSNDMGREYMSSRDGDQHQHQQQQQPQHQRHGQAQQQHSQGKHSRGASGGGGRKFHSGNSNSNNNNNNNRSRRDRA